MIGLEAFNEHEMVAIYLLSWLFPNVLIALIMNCCYSKLICICVSDIELTWFTNYLSDGRQQVVSCNGKLSGKKDVKIGIPQGSTLGPTLFFLFFINDIISSLKSTRCSIFADDVIIYSVSQ